MRCRMSSPRRACEATALVLFFGACGVCKSFQARANEHRGCREDRLYPAKLSGFEARVAEVREGVEQAGAMPPPL